METLIISESVDQDQIERSVQSDPDLRLSLLVALSYRLVKLHSRFGVRNDSEFLVTLLP